MVVGRGKSVMHVICCLSASFYQECKNVPSAAPRRPWISPLYCPESPWPPSGVPVSTVGGGILVERREGGRLQGAQERELALLPASRGLYCAHPTWLCLTGRSDLPGYRFKVPLRSASPILIPFSLFVSPFVLPSYVEGFLPFLEV